MTPIEKLIKRIRHLLDIINYPEISGSEFIREIDEAVQEFESAPNEGCYTCKHRTNGIHEMDCYECSHFMSSHWEAK